jgi:two-component system NarL family response regulator
MTDKNSRRRTPDEASKNTSALASLSKQEKVVLAHIAEGRETKEIAVSMRLSPKTIDSYRQQICKKLDLHNVAHLTRFAIANGLVDAE